MSDSEKIQALCRALGYNAVAVAVGKSEKTVSNQAMLGKLPSRWFLCIRALVQAHGYEIEPAELESLFNFEPVKP